MNDLLELDALVENYINVYYENGCKKLHVLVDQIVNKKFGGVSNHDMDEFYSDAGYVVANILKKRLYDPSKGPFEGFLHNALVKSFIDLIKAQKCDKRVMKVYETDKDGNKVLDDNGKPKYTILQNVSLDAPVNDGETAYENFIASDFSVENEVFNDQKGFTDSRFQEFYDGLSKIQRQILEMKMNNIPVTEIKKKLDLSDNKYQRLVADLTKFDRICILKNSGNIEDLREDEGMEAKTQTMENCKTDKISIASIIKKIDKRMLRFDHPLQRESNQWTPSMKGNLISDILQGNKLYPLIFAEQIINGIPTLWGLDGKQRTSNVYSFQHDGYRISRNIRRWMIKYQTNKKDENGNDVLDENGFPIAVNAEFDIRGKKFSELPDELQDKILDYTFNYDQYLNCNDDEIGYHIERYNDGKNMNNAQKGTVKLGTEYAEIVKSIAAMPFFSEKGGYKVSDAKNGTINRVVAESIMTINFLNDWKKKPEDMCEYIKNNASIEDFEDFEDIVERLENVVDDVTGEMFDSKDSFLWFGLFSVFMKTGKDDRQFIEFMTEFARSLHSKVINSKSFDDLNTKSTKDKTVVLGKMEHLKQLMYEYLKVDDEPNDVTFIKDNVGSDITNEDISSYKEDLEILSLDVDNKNPIVNDKANQLSMLAVVAYGYKNDILLDKWFVDYLNRNNTYIKDQKQNYLHMVDDLQNYIQSSALKSA